MDDATMWSDTQKRQWWASRSQLDARMHSLLNCLDVSAILFLLVLFNVNIYL